MQVFNRLIHDMILNTAERDVKSTSLYGFHCQLIYLIYYLASNLDKCRREDGHIYMLLIPDNNVQYELDLFDQYVKIKIY